MYDTRGSIGGRERRGFRAKKIEGRGRERVGCWL